MTTVICVLRSGGDFRPEHVARLHGQVMTHSPAGTEFLCLTDMPDVLGLVPWVGGLHPAWPGWWSKLHAFCKLGPALYLDLDVSVIGDLEPLLEIATSQEFVMARGFFGDQDPNPFNSSVMGWAYDRPSPLFDLFDADSIGFMARHSKLPGASTRWGDQGFIIEHYDGSIAAWQDLLPGAVVSFKRGALLGEDLSRCAVLASHGKPRPWARGGADGWHVKHHHGTAASVATAPQS